MSQVLSTPILLMLIGLGLILLAICGILAWTIRLSHRIQKLELPARKTLLLIAALQVVPGVVTVLVLRAINNDPVLDLGVGLGVTILSGLPLLKYLLKIDWKPSLLTWAFAAAMQVFLVPLVALVMAAILVVLLTALFPPQF